MLYLRCKLQKGRLGMNKDRGNEYRTTIICVDSYHGGAMSGRLYNPRLDGAEAFSSAMQLILRIDSLLDA